MGVAFKWEVACQAALATIHDAFVPCFQWFWVKYLDSSKLMREIKRGCTAVLSDEAFTVHPLLMSVLLWVAVQWGVVVIFVGEALQINCMQDERMLARGWFQRFAFQMNPWLNLEQNGQLLYFRRQQNFRLPPAQFQMLMRVSADLQEDALVSATIMQLYWVVCVYV